MTHMQMIEGTTEDIASQLRQSYAGQRLRVFVEPEDDADLTAGLPDPPNTIRDRAHLIELLRAGMNGEPRPITDHEWAELRQEVRDRLALRKP